MDNKAEGDTLTALSKTVDGKVNIYGASMGTDTDKLTAPGWYHLQTGYTNGPAGVNVNYSLLEVKCNGLVQTLHLLHDSTQGIYERKRASGNYAWSAWVKIAICETPTKYALPLKPGFTTAEDCYYTKDQFGFVHIICCAQITSDSPSPDMGIFEMPVGYRPLTRFRFGGMFGWPGMSNVPQLLQMTTTGCQLVSASLGKNNVISFNISYFAGQ